MMMSLKFAKEMPYLGKLFDLHSPVTPLQVGPLKVKASYKY